MVRAARDPLASITTQGPAPASWLAVWWRAVRPFSFTASVTPVLVGTGAAASAGYMDWLRFLAALAGSVAIHAGTNLLNDYYDHRRGVDASQPIGPSGVIQEGLLAPRTVLIGGASLFGVGAALGLWLVSQAGWPILVAGVLSILAGYAYTGGPVPLGYIGVGDLLVFLFMGPVIVLGAYYVQAETVSRAAFFASLPVGALVTAILVVNNLRDLQTDRLKGKRTFATFLGPDATRREYLLLLVLAYVFVAAGVAARALPTLALVAFVSAARAASVWKVVREETDPRSLTRGGLRGTAALHFRVGAVLALAFVLS